MLSCELPSAGVAIEVREFVIFIFYIFLFIAFLFDSVWKIREKGLISDFYLEKWLKTADQGQN